MKREEGAVSRARGIYYCRENRKRQVWLKSEEPLSRGRHSRIKDRAGVRSKCASLEKGGAWRGEEGGKNSFRLAEVIGR